MKPGGDILSERYRKSEEFLARAERSIPLGSQTFSKSKTQYPFGVSPYFITRGAGSKVWDIDGNEYVDFVNSLLAITLGHGDPDVMAAVKAQLEDGTIFSLAHPLETEVAERIIDMAPCAEMVRFGKNGSDTTAGAIRLARAYTKRDRVAVCGYHGWQDWYIGSTARHLGVPQAVRDLTHTFAYNDLASLEALFKAHRDEFAAVILEPMNVFEPAPGFLEGLKELTHRNGALLVFDETITGFRFANGGAQELFGVTPDLATYGKGLANGYPLSAIAGRADVMRLMEEIFFSFTLGGEALSLAAAKATLDKLKREPVLKTIAAHGRAVAEGAAAIVAENNIGDFVSLAGQPCWSFVLIKDTPEYNSYEIKTLFLQEMLARGVMTLGTHNMSYAHDEKDVAKLLSAYREVMPILADAVRNRALKQLLRCEPLQPLFKVR
jgi:glutamate-1-semialdehyde 2,1-aminomutase